MKTELRRVRSSMASLLRLLDQAPLMTEASLPAAAMTASAGVTAGFEMYLCLWKTVPDTRVARESVIHMVQAR